MNRRFEWLRRIGKEVRSLEERWLSTMQTRYAFVLVCVVGRNLIKLSLIELKHWIVIGGVGRLLDAFIRDMPLFF